MMMSEVGVYRSEEKLTGAISKTRDFYDRSKSVRAPGSRWFNMGWHTSLDVKHMTLIAQTIAISALLRKESRGAHTRVDFPDTLDNFQKINIVTRLVDDEVKAQIVEREPLPDDLADIVYERTGVTA